MKESPDIKKLEGILRSSKLSSSGFMGSDRRSLGEIIDADLAVLSELGCPAKDIASKMQDVTNKATEALGNWIKIDDSRQAMITEVKGRIPCPWPHASNFAKRVTILRDTATGDEIKWSDLNIHLIAEHNFFEGKGCYFRVEPAKIAAMLF
ncbi:MAG: hypothetical protein JW804_05345 [Sedimentisphaerales bacterium]|nr:hypothetical protein [Sedimentisphaerales bacterium]